MSLKNLSKMGGGTPPAQPYDPNRSQNPARVSDGACYLDDLEVGDAGAGFRRMRRKTIFSRLFDNVAASTLNPMSKVYTVVQDPPRLAPIDDCRLQFFNVQFWGQSLIRLGNDGDELFLPDRNGNGPNGPLTQVSTPLKGFIKTDEGMWHIFDVLGSRRFEVYATHVDAGFLAPEMSYDIGGRDPSGADDTTYDGIVDQSYLGVSISMVTTNSTQVSDDYTVVVRIPDAGTPVLVPIPAGSKTVCITSTTIIVPVLVNFTWNPNLIAWKGNSDLPVTDEVIVNRQTRPLCIPGTPFMRIETQGAAGPVVVALTFSKEL